MKDKIIVACKEKEGISVVIEGNKQDVVCAFGSIILAVSNALDVDPINFALVSAKAANEALKDKTEKITDNISFTEEKEK